RPVRKIAAMTSSGATPMTSGRPTAMRTGGAGGGLTWGAWGGTGWPAAIGDLRCRGAGVPRDERGTLILVRPRGPATLPSASTRRPLMVLTSRVAELERARAD